MIEIKDLTFKWKDDTSDLLSIDNLKIKKGERIFIKGHSGSGKSTLLSLLSGIHIPQKGTITILGQSINILKPSQRDEFRANHIGYIFQTFNLVPYLSVLENVLLPIQFSKVRQQRIANLDVKPIEEAKRLLQIVGLSSNNILNKMVTELSVGQQQRVAACRALLGNPELIIADEPTSSLDEDTQKAFLDLLLKECLANQTTLLFVSHDNRFSKHFDKTIFLENGMLKEFVTEKSFTLQ